MPDPEKPTVTRHGPARVVFAALAILLGAILLAVLGLLAVNALDRRDPNAFLPARPDLYVSVASLSGTITRLSGLRVADELLAGPGQAGIRSLLLTVRSSPLLASKAFAYLAAHPACVALEGDRVIAAVDLGPFLGAAARLLPLVGPILAPKDFSFESSGGVSRILLGKAPSLLRLAAVGRILLVSTGSEAIDRALARGKASGAAAIADAASAPNLAVAARLSGLELSAPKGKALRLIIGMGGLVSRLALSGPAAATALGAMKFPGEAIVDLDVADDRISLEASLPMESSDAGLSSLLGRRSGVPAILSLLPASTAYASLASIVSPGALYPIALRFMGQSGKTAYAKAESACRVALGIGFDELLYSWAGDEFGAFGLAEIPDPVFYVRIADEAARKKAFEKISSSALVDDDSTTVVDGLRIPRLVLPWYVRDALSLAGAELPQPYWLELKGFLFASASAEALSAVSKAASAGDSLPRSAAFRGLVGSAAGMDAAATVYYSLDRGIPFFLRGSSPVERALRLYKSGALFLRTGPDGLRAILVATRGKASPGLRELESFPLAAGGRLAGAPIVLGSGSDAVLVLQLAGGRLIARRLAGGGDEAKAEAKLDGEAFLLAAKGRVGENVLWALTRAGTVYRFDARLEHLRPFPLTASSRPSSPPGLAPALAAGASAGEEPGIAFGAKGGGILVIGADGSERRIELTGESALLSPPAFADGMIAAYPKAFDGRLLLLGADGATLPGWPVPAGGIAFGTPVFASRADGSRAVGFLTQAGELTLRDTGGSLLPGFPLRIAGTFLKAPVAARDGSSLYLLDSEGMISRVSAAGEILAQRREDSLKGGEASLLLADAYGDGREEVFAAGSGDALRGYSADLLPLPGFPAKGAWLPCVADLEGDGRPDLVTGGLDDTVHAYSLQ